MSDAEANADWNGRFAGRSEWDKADAFLPSISAGLKGDVVLFAEIKDLMMRAAREGLPYDKGSDGKGFKWPMARCKDDIGHIKMDIGVDQHRIYFAAPQLPGWECHLIALFYGKKHARAAKQRELQNQHIDAAAAAYGEWRRQKSGLYLR